MAVAKAPHTALRSLSLAVILSAAAFARDTVVVVAADRWVVSVSPFTGAVVQYHLQLPNDFFVAAASWVDTDNLIYLIAEAYHTNPGVMSWNAT
jgi:hypothetical protein